MTAGLPAHWVVRLADGKYIAGVTAEPGGEMMVCEADGPMQVFQTVGQAEHIAGILDGAESVPATIHVDAVTAVTGSDIWRERWEALRGDLIALVMLGHKEAANVIEAMDKVEERMPAP